MDIPAKNKFLPLDLANGGAGKRTLKPLDLAQRPAFPLDALELGRHEKPDLVTGSLEKLQAVPAAHNDARKEAQTFVSQAFFGDALGMGSGGFLSIVISLVIIGVAAFSLLLDFDMADRAVREGAPASFAWYVAFGLMTTLVWLYIEILRLLSILRR